MNITANAPTAEPIAGTGIAGIAYSGGTMKLPGWQYPVVVDLAGMTVPESVPLLANHDNSPGSRLGVVAARNSGSAVSIDGRIVSDTCEASGIVHQGRAGADWQLSIGADVVRYRVAREPVTLNGRRFEAPCCVITESVLREVSVVAVGADAATNMKIAARFTFPDGAGFPLEFQPQPKTKSQPERNNFHMNTENLNLNHAASDNTAESGNSAAVAAVAQERERIRAIRGICGGEFDEIENEAVADGSAPETVAARVLAAIRAGRPGSNLGIRVKNKPEGSEARATLEAALSIRAGIEPDELVKSCGERAVEAGMSESGMSMKQFIVECLRADGIECGRMFDNGTIRSAFSSVTLPGILSNVANKKLLQAFHAQPVIATKLCAGADLSDFKEHQRFRLTDVGDLEIVAPDGQIKDGGLMEESGVNQLETYGKKFCLTRKMILNDDLGAFMKVPAAMGTRAARLIDQLFFKRLLANPLQNDGNALFSSAHHNLLTGSSSALSADALKLAIQAFLDQTDADGQPINIEPRYLLVPTALKHTAIELVKGATLIMSGGDERTVRPALNVLADENLRVLSSPYLSNSGYTGKSSTAWYLFAEPHAADTWEIGYLHGKRTPTVERGETDFNTLGIWFRVYFDLGIREQDHRGMVKANGAA